MAITCFKNQEVGLGLFIVRALGHWLVTIINLWGINRINCSFPLHFPHIFSAFKSWNVPTVFRFWDFQHNWRTEPDQDIKLQILHSIIGASYKTNKLKESSLELFIFLYSLQCFKFFTGLPNNNYEVQKPNQSVPAKCSSTHFIGIKKTLAKSTDKWTWIVSRQNERKLQFNWSFENFFSFL